MIKIYKLDKEDKRQRKIEKKEWRNDLFKHVKKNTDSILMRYIGFTTINYNDIKLNNESKQKTLR